MNRREDDPQSIFGGDNQSQEGPQEKPPARSSGLPWKAAIVVGLILVVGVVIVAKIGSGDRPASDDTGVTPSGEASSERDTPSEAASSAESPSAFGPDTVLATANGKEITLSELNEMLEALPPEYRSQFERQKSALLEELISRELLLEQARARDIAQTQAYRDAMAEHEAHPGHEEHVLTDVLLRREVLDKITVTEEDLRRAYEEVKDQLPPGTSLEDVKDQLRPYVRQEKQNTAIESYLADLREEAAITRNQDWIEAQQARAADNPLDRALQKDLPVLADFGQGTCIPCKMMKPILEDLKEEYAGRAEILIIETGEYPAVTRRVGIRAIPTQIFYNADGEEVSRHQGFMSREAIVEQLRDMGVE